MSLESKKFHKYLISLKGEPKIMEMRIGSMQLKLNLPRRRFRLLVPSVIDLGWVSLDYHYVSGFN